MKRFFECSNYLKYWRRGALTLMVLGTAIGAILLTSSGMSYASNDTPNIVEAADKILDIQEVKSSSGEITAWLVQDDSVPLVAINFFFKPQKMLYTKDTQGVTNLLSRMLDEGAGNYDSQAFQKMLEDFNISMSFSGGRDSFSGSLYYLKKYQNQGLDALRLAINEPRFDKEPLERMRRSVLTGVRRNIGKPRWVAARLTNVYAFPDHYYALNSGGTLTSLTQFNADDLRYLMSQVFTKDALHVAVSGDITAAELAPQLDFLFGKLPKTFAEEQGNVEPSSISVSSYPSSPSIVVFEKDIPQTTIRMIWPAIGAKDPDYAAFSVMNYILGSSGFSSRLMSEIREKRGLTYGVYSSHLGYDKADRLVVSTSTKHDNLDEMRRLIKQEFSKIAQNPVTDAELQSAKDYLTGSLVLAFTNTKGIAGGVSGLLYNDRPMDYLDGYKQRILDVSVEDIQRVAKKIFEKENGEIINPIEIYVGQNPASLAEGDFILQTTLPDTE